MKLDIVTAVSRPENLHKIRRSIERALGGTGVDLVWRLIFDDGQRLCEAAPILAGTEPLFKCELRTADSGPSKFGIAQKNLGMDLLRDDAFYHCLDDDNVVHPRFFAGISGAYVRNQEKLAFAFNQRRWDQGDFVASPETMVPYKIDNTMFVVHKSLLGSDRYDFTLAGVEDGHLFHNLHLKNPSAWVFLGEFLAFYNFLRHFPDGDPDEFEA